MKVLHLLKTGLAVPGVKNMVRGVSYLGLVLFFFVYGPRQGQGQGQLNHKKIEKGQTPVF